MRIFVAGATGVIGRRLVPLLTAAGHEVTGMARKGGAGVLAVDALDAERVRAAVVAARPDVVVHQLTDLRGFDDVRRIDQQFVQTNRLRTVGTDNLLAAADAAGAERFVAASYTGWPYARTGGPVKSEEDPLDPDPPRAMRPLLSAIRHLEDAVVARPGGLVLRYGSWYGPGTTFDVGGPNHELVRRRRFPVVGAGGGVWSFVHVDDAAAATALAIEMGATGLFNIVDDDPAPLAEWLPALAAAAGAKPPRRVPVWMARLAVGEHGVMMCTEVKGASNRKARAELGWEPLHPTWRPGFDL